MESSVPFLPDTVLPISFNLKEEKDTSSGTKTPPSTQLLACCTYSTSAVDVRHRPVHFPSEVGEDDGEAEVGPLFPRLRIHFLHQAGQLLQSGIHPEKHTHTHTPLDLPSAKLLPECQLLPQCFVV